jgi:hypothetical protein
MTALERLKVVAALNAEYGGKGYVEPADLALAIEAINLLQRARKYIKRGPFDLFVEMDKNIAALEQQT